MGTARHDWSAKEDRCRARGQMRARGPARAPGMNRDRHAQKIRRRPIRSLARAPSSHRARVTVRASEKVRTIDPRRAVARRERIIIAVPREQVKVGEARDRVDSAFVPGMFALHGEYDVKLRIPSEAAARRGRTDLETARSISGNYVKDV